MSEMERNPRVQFLARFNAIFPSLSLFFPRCGNGRNRHPSTTKCNDLRGAAECPRPGIIHSTKPAQKAPLFGASSDGGENEGTGALRSGIHLHIIHRRGSSDFCPRRKEALVFQRGQVNESVIQTGIAFHAKFGFRGVEKWEWKRRETR